MRLLFIFLAGVFAQDQVPLGADPVRGQFMSPEHAFLGDHVTLRFPDRNITGGNQVYTVGGNRISYGTVVALAGDFFADYETFGCPLSISDGWINNPAGSISRFQALANAMLQSAKPDYTKCILNYISDQSSDVCGAASTGYDPVQRYKQTSATYDASFALCGLPLPRYPFSALCNWDHFGYDAINAYKAGHTAALQLAAKRDLSRAYFFEAYAQHFLTDLFSAGHIRTPRRQLHHNIDFTHLIALWPADLINRAQHDEDSFNGLWVTNKLGESWAAYGDMELMSSKSWKNIDQAIDAIQRGVDEIWEAYEFGRVKPADSFKALEKAPDLDRFKSLDNFAPLFSWDPAKPRIISQRAMYDDRSVAQRTQKDLDMPISVWSSIKNEVQKAGPWLNPLPASADHLLPEVSLVQVREVAKDTIGLNRYSTITSRAYKQDFCNQTSTAKTRTSWSMTDQKILSGIPAGVSWKTAIALEGNQICVIGNRQRSTVFLGVENGNVVWSKETDTGALVVDEAFYDSLAPGIIIYQKGKDNSSFSFNSLKNGAIDIQVATWTSAPVINAFPLKGAFLSASAKGWTVFSYRTLKATFTPSDVDSAPHAVLPGHNDTIVRMFDSHGLQGDDFRLEILDANFKLVKNATYPRTWDRKSTYDSIFITPEGALVLLLRAADKATLTTVAFPPDFGPPLTSAIIAPGKLTTYTAAWLKSLGVWNVKGGVLQALDNFGVLGFRVLNTAGDGQAKWQYKAGGQIPAIAGQKSRSLGLLVGDY